MEIIEREEELEALRQAWADGASGSTSVAVIEGAAGCGKTLLLETAVSEAAAAGSPVVQLGRSRVPRITVRGGHNAETAETVLHSLAEAVPVHGDRPLVLSLDDAHQAGHWQLGYILDLMDLYRSQGIVVLIAQPSACAFRDFRFHAELLRQAVVRRIRVRKLSPHGVGRLIPKAEATAVTSSLTSADAKPLTSAVLSGDVAEIRQAIVVDELHRITGGNPLLLRALIQERLTPAPGLSAAGGAWPIPAQRGLFAQALLACVQSSGPHAYDLAVALAVLGVQVESGVESSVEMLGEVLELSPAAAREGVRVLNEVGVVDDLRFRHPVAETAVLESVSGQRRTALHTRAAELLHATGAHPIVVARHLVAAQKLSKRWGVSVLQDAAHHMLARNDPQEAIRLLDLAARECQDERLRAAARVSIAIITCRQSPSAAEQLLRDALRSDQQTPGRPHATEMLTRILVQGWDGWTAEASEPTGLPGASRLPGSVMPHPSELWSALLMVDQNGEPGREGAGSTGRPAEVSERPGSAAGPRRHRAAYPVLSAASTLWTASERGLGPEAADAAERRLGSTPLIDSSLPVIVNDLKTLAFADRPHIASSLARRFCAEAQRSNAPGWEAMLASAAAEVALYCGMFDDALEYAREAVTRVPLRRHTMFSVGPVISQLLARTAAGQYTEAGLLLGTVVPEQLGSTIDGLAYLRARGRYLLATGDPHAAAGSFTYIGELARAWGVDRPALIPWRLDAAEALQAAGDFSAAGALLKEQGDFRDAGSHRLRGIQLRLLAAQSGTRARIRLLRQSIEELQQSRDLYEAARSIADLGSAYEADGEPAKARMARRKAWRQAKECGAHALCEEVLPGFRPAEAEIPQVGTAAFGRLSESERRVAQLAARGHANREISTSLHITVSTVEQHLTRIYRKLHIEGRGALGWVNFGADEAG